jgi:peptidoglycan/xylan/chitin deacetylase (PgdA/CDA1 family)
MSTGMATRKVTLTFDNGPTPGVTDAVLNILADRGIPATFFVVGSRLGAPAGRPLARRAVSEGHRIGHHTATHTVLLGLADDAEAAVQAEIAGFAGELQEFEAGEKLFRPYADGGVLDQRVFSEAAVRYLQEHDYTCVLWNSVPHDWDDPNGWVDRGLAQVLDQPWTVVVLHDIAGACVARLPDFLDVLSSGGAQIVQDYPDSCLPIRAGRAKFPLSHLTTEAAS